jgi:hypothetical protein
VFQAVIMIVIFLTIIEVIKSLIKFVIQVNSLTFFINSHILLAINQTIFYFDTKKQVINSF